MVVVSVDMTVVPPLIVQVIPSSSSARGLIVRMEMNGDCRVEAGIMVTLLSVVLVVH